MVTSTAAQTGLLCFTLFLVLCFKKLIFIFLIYFIWMFENQVLNVSGIFFRYTENLTNKQKAIITATKSFLGLVLNLKRTAYKNSLNQLFHHIWLFIKSGKIFLPCAATIVDRGFLTPLIYEEPPALLSPLPLSPPPTPFFSHYSFYCFVYLSLCLITQQLMCYFA